jgi:hypothetical protein
MRKKLRTKQLAKTSIIWHYTHGGNFRRIVNDAVIKRATSGVVAPERPVTWFSVNQRWEATATRVPLLGQRVDEMQRLTHRACGGLMRIGIEAQHAPFGIGDFHREARCKLQIVEDLRRTGIRVGAVPTEWRFSLEDIPATLWKRIEIWDGSDAWIPMEFSLQA